MNNNNFCNNCGLRGHLFHQCKLPITSIGLIVFYKEPNEEVKYLMIRRKDSLGYVDFMRGKYNLTSKDYLLNIINEMTMTEKHALLTSNFNDLWNKLWGEYVNNQYKTEKTAAQEKFKLLQSGIIMDNKYYNLKTLIAESNTTWCEPEWGFPKGRRNYMETDIKCAIREFQEETGINKENIQIINNLIPFDETFIGSNYKSYKHTYYIAKMINFTDFNCFQKSEVSKLEWKNTKDALASIRNYNIERKQIITNMEEIFARYDIK